MTLSRQFTDAAVRALARARQDPDLAIAYAAHVVPVYIHDRATPEQSVAGVALS